MTWEAQDWNGLLQSEPSKVLKTLKTPNIKHVVDLCKHLIMTINQCLHVNWGGQKQRKIANAFVFNLAIFFLCLKVRIHCWSTAISSKINQSTLFPISPFPDLDLISGFYQNYKATLPCTSERLWIYFFPILDQCSR